MKDVIKNPMLLWGVIGVLLMLSLSLTGVGTIKQQVVIFDKGVAIAKLAQTLNAHKASQAQQARVIKEFSKAMSAVLKEQARRQGLVIVAPNTVIAGGNNITEALIPKIASRMKTKKSEVRHD